MKNAVRFEYMIVEEAGHLDGPHSTEWPGILCAKLSELSADGWEVVSSVGKGDSAWFRVLLRREVKP